MATVRFGGYSPYSKGQESYPSTDLVHTRYLENLKPSNKSRRKKNSPPVDLALFGVGRAGTVHLSNMLVNHRCRVKYIVEQDEQSAKEVQARFRLPNDVKVLTSTEESVVLDDKSVKGVIVATPTHLHEELVIKALKARKAVMCEKPISCDIEAVKRCYDAAEASRRPLLCAMHKRFDSAVKELRSRVHEGAVGQVHKINTVYRDCPLPSLNFMKQSGGFINDCALHDIDYICWVIGEYPEAVVAVGSAFVKEIKEIGDVDTMNLTMRFPSGTISNTDLSRNSIYGYDQRLEVFGSEGTIMTKNTKPINVVHYTSEDVSQCPIHYSFASKFAVAFREQIDHFIDLAEGITKTPLITREEIMKVASICKAAEKSLEEGKLVKVQY